jgi:hypothetical protein
MKGLENLYYSVKTAKILTEYVEQGTFSDNMAEIDMDRVDKPLRDTLDYILGILRELPSIPKEYSHYQLCMDALYRKGMKGCVYFE